ncbi:MAG: hypothetical protein R6V72_20365 [Cyclobacterium sp.]|uniref:hypothetical protein n=1 Tax=Cyclobacterium sp. TaxID=1966343 RepID=UPI003970FCFE
MEDKKNHLDERIRQRLSEHQVVPEDWVWEEISSRLEKKKKPVIVFWKGWAAAAVLLLGFSWFLIRFEMPEINQPLSQDMNKSIQSEETYVSQEETDDDTDQVETNEPEQVVRHEKEQKSSANTPLLPKKTTEESPLIAQAEDKNAAPRKQELMPDPPAAIEPEWQEFIPVPDIDLAQEEASQGEIGTEDDYTVRIVSRGYALQPDKEKLVDGLENKIGGFFNKVDEGFGELQDAKNNLFASLGNKREKRVNR